MPRFLKERQDITDMCRRLSEQGYFAGTGGNIGMRLDADHFAVTPTATDYERMRLEDVVILRLDTLEQLEGERKPSVEKGLHQRMLAAYPLRQVSLHTHQPIASAVALLHETLSWPVDVPPELGRQVGLVPYRPSGTGMLAKALGKALKPDTFAYLLASHGVICAATDLESAAVMARWIEAAAATHLLKRIEHAGSCDGVLRQLITETLGRAVTLGA